MKDQKHKELTPDFRKWILDDVMIYLNSQSELKNLESKLQPNYTLNINDCFSYLGKSWFDNSCLQFMNHPILMQQHTSYHCGFHAFYNMACFINIILSRDSHKKLKYTYKLFDRFS